MVEMMIRMIRAMMMTMVAWHLCGLLDYLDGNDGDGVARLSLSGESEFVLGLKFLDFFLKFVWSKLFEPVNHSSEFSSASVNFILSFNVWCWGCHHHHHYHRHDQWSLIIMIIILIITTIIILIKMTWVMPGMKWKAFSIRPPSSAPSPPPCWGQVCNTCESVGEKVMNSHHKTSTSHLNGSGLGV